MGHGRDGPGHSTRRPAADRIAVTVNGHDIMESDVKNMFQAQMARRMGNRKMPAAQAERMFNSVRPQVLDRLIGTRLLDEQVEQAKINVTEKELREALERALQAHLMRKVLTRDAFAEQVKAMSGDSLEAYLDSKAADPDFKQSVLQRMLIEKKFPDKVTVTEDEVEKHYQQRMDWSYNTVKASHILIGTQGAKTDEDRKAAREKIEQILVEAKKPGADFAALAREHSTCSSKNEGGDLGFFPRKERMVEPFAEAAFALKPGEISDIVETKFGYHIIKVTDAKVVTLAEARESIIEELTSRKVFQALRQYLSELKQSANIKYPPGKEPRPASRPATSPASATRPA